MFCNNCGATVNDGAHFCGKCGHPMPADDQPVPAPASASANLHAASADPALAPPPGPYGAPVPAPSKTPPDAKAESASVAARYLRPLPILAFVVAVAVLVSGIAVFSYRSGLWGTRKLPAAEMFQPPQGQRLTANIVADSLKKQGIRTKVSKVYSGKSNGEFVGYDGVKAGDRVSAGQTVTIHESMGPGVPKGTVGRKAADIVTGLKAMDVPVTFHTISVEDTTKYPEGTVVATSPSDGAAVTNKQTGIQVAIADKNSGEVGYDIIGMDKDKAKAALEDKGYVVTLVPRFTSKQYLGKVSDSSPKPGVNRLAGDTVTLYYGVDASKRDEVVGKPADGIWKNEISLSNTTALAGKYCTDGGSCVTLTPASTKGTPSTLGVDGHPASGSEDNSEFWDGLSLCAYSQDNSGCIPHHSGYDSMKGFLADGDTGAMELYAGFGHPNCGNNVFVGDGPVACINGETVPNDNVPSIADGLKELKDLPKEFFVVMPVGANLDKLKSSGYFEGSSDYRPDTNRPYLIRRDNASYPALPAFDGETPRTGESYSPGEHLAPFRQAPNAKNVYYLVEGGRDLDWSSLPSVSVEPSESSGGKTTDGDSSKSAAVDSATKQAFSTLAGNYTFVASGEGSTMYYMTMKSDGSFSGYQSTANVYKPGLSNANAPRKHIAFSGKFASAVNNGDGSYTLQCDANSFTAEGDRSEIGFEHCGKFGAYPAGSGLDVLKGRLSETYRMLHGSNTSLKYWTLVNEGGGEHDYGIYERDPRYWEGRR